MIIARSELRYHDDDNNDNDNLYYGFDLTNEKIMTIVWYKLEAVAFMYTYVHGITRFVTLHIINFSFCFNSIIQNKCIRYFLPIGAKIRTGILL